MAFINDIYEVKVYTTLGNQAGLNVFHHLVSNVVGTGVSDQQLADHYAGLYPSVYKNIMSSAASFRGVGVRRIKPTISLEVYSTIGQGPGLVTGDPLPKQIAGMITLRTALPGRANRGRMYVPFPAEAHNDADTTPTAPYMVLLGNLGMVVWSDSVAGGGANTQTMSPGVYHRALGTLTRLTTYTTRDRWATQRRRGDYGKPNILPI